MAKQDFDLTVDLKKHINEPFNQYYEKAKSASDGGKLKLVSERLCQPYEGDGFELKKGQIIRYELTHGPQVLDTMYLVKSRPNDEWACTYHSSHFGGQTLYEGMHYFSNTPYARPLLTFVRDTVDGVRIIKDFGKSASHNFVYNSGRCTLGTLERIFRIPHCNCCDSNMLKGIYEVDQVLMEDLDADQLTDETFDFNAIFGVGFRFDGNPFKKKASSSSGGGR